MTELNTKNLRLYTERLADLVEPRVDSVGSLPGVLRAFTRLTSCPLQYVAGSEPKETNDLTWSAPVSPGVGTTLGHLRLDLSACQREAIDPNSVRVMASALAHMLNELMQTRQALWQREAELAAGVPLVPCTDEEKHLAARLEAVLRAGADAIGCQAAALYLLDEATTQLKARSTWGLPLDRLMQPARPLKGAVADLEALLGHAVVLEDTDAMPNWKVPEDFPAAVCVPVSTPSTLLGTLWTYCDRKRDFTDQETNILEVVAGRIAADLEREMLLSEGIDAAQLKRQIAAAERLQRHQLPTISPLLDGWELAGWTAQAEIVGGNFHDWFCLPNGLLAVAVGDAMNRGLEAVMAANTVRAALRAHGQYHRRAEQTLKRVNLALWTGSAGDQFAALFFGLIETATGRVCCSSAGQPGIVVVRQDGWELLSQASPLLGKSPETDYQQFGYELQPGEALIVLSNGFRNAPDSEGCPLGEAGIAEPLVGRIDRPAEELVALARQAFDAHADLPDLDDRTVMVIKRTPT